ncbi:hypothetical protein FNV43_RR00617 [Rhamnella rubrinervis]|uniref:Aconitase/3-isopropylmalate dehydratase large subunit alpha/beta/alpha domain-containing protein n=1 Tax=Rhamnella rubrinervis TaxID=2594499 RepID=A0A8K0MS46_9ROSA|nr:hypothetical protein FNV43_RR00617 [Rhamnella rubrinervis]
MLFFACSWQKLNEPTVTIGEISVAGATYKAMEFVGTTVESLTVSKFSFTANLLVAKRMTLCNMVVEAGGKNGVVPADSTTYKYLEDKTSALYEPVYSDEQARFLYKYHFDISKLEPLVAKMSPHSPDNHALARECKDVKMHRVYIGSCTGGKTEDFLVAAKVFLASVWMDIYSLQYQHLVAKPVPRYLRKLVVIHLQVLVAVLLGVVPKTLLHA